MNVSNDNGGAGDGESTVSSFGPTSGSVLPVSEDTCTLLGYPFDFFPAGKIPASDDECSLLWAFRKGRPLPGQIETKREDGIAMKKEMYRIKKSLHDFIGTALLKGIISASKKLQLVMPTTSQFPTVEKDVIATLCALPPPVVRLDENGVLQCVKNQETLITTYEVLYEFHNRTWLANQVDAWLAKEGMRLLPKPSNITQGQRKRTHRLDRGGFSIVAGNGKSGPLRRYGLQMMKQGGWKLATTQATMRSDGLTLICCAVSIDSRKETLDLTRADAVSVKTTPKTVYLWIDPTHEKVSYT
jgi:hypothetical protein